MEGGGLNSEYADGLGSTLGYLNDWEVYLGVEYMLNTENKTQESLRKNKWRGHIIYPIAQTELIRQLREGTGVARSIEHCRTEQVALVIPIGGGGHWRMVHFPENWKETLELKSKKDKLKYELKPEAMTDAFKCRKCGSRSTSYYEVQTRSADEPMTQFITCLDCNNHWKQ